jgi:hypothetical protein
LAQGRPYVHASTVEMYGILKAKNVLVNRYATSLNAPFTVWFIRVTIFTFAFRVKAVEPPRA